MATIARSIRPGDIEHVADNIRAMDRRECEELFEVDPLEGLRESYDNSPWSAAIEDDGKLICLVGVGAHLGAAIGLRGRPWLVAVEGIERHPRAFATMTEPVVARMLEEYPLLSNIVHSENDVSIRWLRRSGFTLDEPEPAGRPGVMLRRFYRARPACRFSR